jgi:hypothetical protein
MASESFVMGTTPRVYALRPRERGGMGRGGDAARADDDAKKPSWLAVPSRADEALNAVRSASFIPSVPVFAHPFETTLLLRG